MSTNKSSQLRGRVVDLPEVKRRRRLENLLYTRSRLAVLAAEHRSHRLDDAIELYTLQLETEQVIADEFPEALEAHIAKWADYEAAAEHHPEVTRVGCSICEAISQHSGAGPDSDRAA